MNDKDGDEYKKFMKEVDKKKKLQRTSINDEIFLTSGPGEAYSPSNASPRRMAGASDEGSQHGASTDRPPQL